LGGRFFAQYFLTYKIIQIFGATVFPRASCVLIFSQDMHWATFWGDLKNSSGHPACNISLLFKDPSFASCEIAAVAINLDTFLAPEIV
jgi:hypothetical protein